MNFFSGSGAYKSNRAILFVDEGKAYIYILHTHIYIYTHTRKGVCIYLKL